MVQYNSESEYVQDVSKRAVLPLGFKVSTEPLKFVPAERPRSHPQSMNLSLIVLDAPTECFAGTFTRNSFPGVPVILARERVMQPQIKGILINNRIANVAAPKGKENALELLDSLAGLLHCRAEELISSSTGVIGWELPVKEMKKTLPYLAETLHDKSCFEIAEAIMTTDSYPKVRTEVIGDGRITGIAKGAGMIEPNMATMLAFILTDIQVSRSELREMLPVVVEDTFNRISVDGDQSTSDMVLVLSSNKSSGSNPVAFFNALKRVCSKLAEDIVRNGEGTGHVIRVVGEGFADNESAHGACKAIVNSPLVKTAFFGNDPNVGRIIAALGDYTGNNGIQIDKDRIVIKLGEEFIFQRGKLQLDGEKEDRLAAYLRDAALDTEVKGYPIHEKCVEIYINLHSGEGNAQVIGTDLSYEYVRENADYRS